MNLKEIHDAAMNGRTFRFTGKIEQFSFENGNLKIDWVFPDAGKPFNSNHDFAYIELAPKYDPCRKFRKGDKAKPRIINGREIPKMPLDVIFTVTGDEDEYGAVPVEYMSPVRGLLTSTTVHAVWLELITPVEEKEPYSVGETTNYFSVDKDDEELSLYWKDKHPNAKAAAEAECDRLNAEYRKEQSNG